jgi:hypothetical protein
MLTLLGSLVLAAQIQESITVSRVLLDVRVVAETEMTMDLTAADFEVKIDGRTVDVESAEWIGTKPREGEIALPMLTPDGRYVEAPKLGRVIVVVVQTDFTRDPARLEGHLKFMQHVRKMLDTIEPGDRVAVFSHDSHLKFRLDFSSDKNKILEAIERSVYLEEPPVPARATLSLADYLDPRAMKRASSLERGLQAIGKALQALPGSKTLILLGWGLGQRTQAGTRMKTDWPAARDALTSARVSMLVLDTTYADFHDLQKGLFTAARQTGGYYAKTHLHPEVAIAEVRRMLEGHYELSIVATHRLRPGLRRLDVRVKREGVRTLAPESVFITD